MKTTTFTLSALAVLVGLAACNKENFNSSSFDPIEGNTVKVTLSANQDITRAAIGNTGSDNKTTVLWSESDSLSVFDGANKNIQFSITSGTGTTSGTFEGEVSETSDSYVALYPYQSAATINSDRSAISGVTLSSTQTATAGSFDPTAALMVAKETTEGTLAFKNAVGYVKVTPTFACTKISLISNNSSDALAGTVSISIADGTPTASVVSDASSSVSISGDISANSTYYIAVLPATLTGGFKLVLTDSEGSETTKASSNTLEIKRNTITDLGSIDKTVTDSTPYVTFSASSEQKFKMTLTGTLDNTFEYSVGDGDSWSSVTFGTEVPFGGTNGDLRLRGKNSSGTAALSGSSPSAYVTIGFSDNNVKVTCSGDIRTLVNWVEYSTVSTADARFVYLFNGCTALTSAPELPATTLADFCYTGMFLGCTSLETAPELPAETLADFCYATMFAQCTSLKSDIELPAKTLTNQCYSGMFMGCTSLTKIILRATSNAGSNPLSDWLNGATDNSGKERILYTDYSGITTAPTGWTLTSLSKL